MCEYCGCQSLEAIELLTREHDQVTNLIGHIRVSLAAADFCSARLQCIELEALLTPHTEVEERALFPALEDEYAGHMDGLRSEHAELSAVLATVLADVDGRGGWSSRLLDALAMLRLHILKEQDGVFPLALAALSAEDWQRVEQVRAEVGSAAQPEPAGKAASIVATASSNVRLPLPTATPAR